MNQSKANRIIPKLRFNLHDRRRLRNPEGSQGRHNKIRKTVTALFKYERIEMNYNRADESRGYAERLISDAIRYGDCHQPTMEMANYWLLEKQLVHKLFKVLVPRYENSGLSYTKLWKAPNTYPGYGHPKCVIELRNNIFPALSEDKSFNKNLIHNVLLDAARKAFNAKKPSATVESSKTETETDLEDAWKESEAGENLVNAALAESNTEQDKKVMMTDNESEKVNTTYIVIGSDIEKESSKMVSTLGKDISELKITEKHEDLLSEKKKK